MEALSVESGRSNTLLKNNLGVQVKMGSALDLVTVLSKTDQLTTVSLVYELKNEKVPAMPIALEQRVNTPP